MEKTYNLIELFSGIGSQAKAKSPTKVLDLSFVLTFNFLFTLLSLLIDLLFCHLIFYHIFKEMSTTLLIKIVIFF